jgi:small subunit ribosomal protein S4e
MASKGNKRHMKRIAAHKRVNITEKKKYKFIEKPLPSGHGKAFSLPIVFVLRDKLGIAKTRKEAKYILNKGLVKVDGKVIKRTDYPVGLMDIIEIDKSYYIITLDKKGRLSIKPLKEQVNEKPVKVKNKVSWDKDIWQLTFHDGKTKLTKDNNIKPGFTLIFDLKNKEIKDVIKPEKGRKCLIITGKHAGKIAELKDIKLSGNQKEAVLTDEENKTFITRFNYLFFLPDNWINTVKG